MIVGNEIFDKAIQSALDAGTINQETFDTLSELDRKHDAAEFFAAFEIFNSEGNFKDAAEQVEVAKAAIETSIMAFVQDGIIDRDAALVLTAAVLDEAILTARGTQEIGHHSRHIYDAETPIELSGQHNQAFEKALQKALAEQRIDADSYKRLQNLEWAHDHSELALAQEVITGKTVGNAGTHIYDAIKEETVARHALEAAIRNLAEEEKITPETAKELYMASLDESIMTSRATVELALGREDAIAQGADLGNTANPTIKIDPFKR